MSIIKGKIIHAHEYVSMQTTYGDWAFYRDEQGRWRCKATHKLAIVVSMKEWLAKDPSDKRGMG